MSLVVKFRLGWSQGDFAIWRYGMAIAAWLVLLTLGGSVQAMPLFAGITGIEAGALQADGVQVLRLTADLPVQYQTQVLDADRVILRIYNARLAQSLCSQEGQVHVLPGGTIQSARLRPAMPSKQGSRSYQEIELTGSGLGRLKLKILGAEALPVSLTVPQAPAPLSSERKQAPVTSTQLLAKSVSPAGKPSSSVPVAQNQPQTTKTGGQRAAVVDRGKAAPAKVTQARNTAKPVVQSAEFEALLSQPVAMMATDPETKSSAKPVGPVIQSVRTLAGQTPLRTQASAIPPSSPVAPMSSSTSTSSPSGTGLPVAESLVESATESKATEAMPPEPAYQVLTALPRYRGGAAPIQAMTTDAEGRPILIRPKNQPIPEFEITQPPESFSVLFQEEGTPAQQRVARLMADSLQAYQAKQYAKALPLIQQALQIQTDNADLYAALAEIQTQLAQKQEAVQAYARAYQYNPQQYGQSYAQALVRVGQRGRAIDILKALYVQAPQQAGLAYMLGTLYEEMGMTEQALPYLKQAAELHPGSVDIQYNLGLAYELSGDNLLAERHYQRALKLDADAQDVQKALARVREAARE